MMNDCTKYEDLMAEALFGELAPEEERRLNAHLDTCDACADEFQSLQTTLAITAERTRPVTCRSDQDVTRWIASRASPCPDQCERTTSGWTWFITRESAAESTTRSSSQPKGPKRISGSRSIGESR